MCEACSKCGCLYSEQAIPHAVDGLVCREYQIAELQAENGWLRTRLDTPIVCLCGSTRFMEAFFAASWELTLLGQIVLSVGVCKHVGPDGHGGEALGQKVVERLDELHLRKIDLADWVLVLNVEGYIGDSTRAELEYARKIGKPCQFLFPPSVYPAQATPPGRDDYPSWETIAAATRGAAKAAEENKT